MTSSLDLPDFLDHVRLRNLRLSTGSVDVLLHRQDNNIGITVTRRDGDVVVVTRYQCLTVNRLPVARANEFYASAFRRLLLPSIELLLEEIPGRRSTTTIALTPENIAIVRRRCEDPRLV